MRGWTRKDAAGKMQTVSIMGCAFNHKSVTKFSNGLQRPATDKILRTSTHHATLAQQI